VAVRPEQILRILELTDSLGIHREAVMIPLAAEKEGHISILPDGKLRVVCPELAQFDKWLIELRSQLEKMDLTGITKKRTLA
jgi:hypothetical protein